jgi:hypothetical protein
MNVGPVLALVLLQPETLLALLRRLDLDDFGAAIAQRLRRIGAKEARQVDDATP